MTPSRIMRTLDFGAMMTVAYTMRRDEREAVAQFLASLAPSRRRVPPRSAPDRRSPSPGRVQRRGTDGGPSRDNARFAPAAWRS